MDHTSNDPIELLLELSDDAGHDLCCLCVQQQRTPADTSRRPMRDDDTDRSDLTVLGAAACELLATELRCATLHVQDGVWTEREALLRILAAARITLDLLPPVIGDWAGRYELAPDEDRLVLPPSADHGGPFSSCAMRLTRHLAENDAGDWVDPTLIAGDVADLHDHVLGVVLWHEMFGDWPVPDGVCDHDEDSVAG